MSMPRALRALPFAAFRRHCCRASGYTSVMTRSATSDKSSIQEDLLQRAAERIRQLAENDAETWRELLAAPRIAETAAHVWACSEFVENSCVRDPSLLRELSVSGALDAAVTATSLAADLARCVTATTEDEVMAQLRKFRRRHLVRIAWRDIAGWADVPETLRELSQLADTCIQFAYRFAYQAMQARYGVPRSGETGAEQQLLILAMGKLGGGELNYSSDIDLILLYPEDGETDGARSVDNAEFFLRVAQKIVHLLATPTVEGFVYRVDLRLRPFGDSGRVALSFAAFEHYLQQHGRDWERYAYVKARPLTAIDEYASLYDDVVRPFVYRRYLDFGVFESLRDMKAMIAREVERRELQDNVKLGPGGIREIEFIVQAFQLIRGGSDRRLQNRALQEVLPLLQGKRLLGSEAVRELGEAYPFLRAVENRLQEWGDEQTHQLPEDELARERLALAMRVPNWSALQAELEHHRGRVAHHFAHTIFGPVTDGDEAGNRCGAFDLEGAPEQRAEALRQWGLDANAEVAEQLEQLRTSSYFRKQDETGRRRLRELLPRLLPRIAATASPATTLARAIKILERIGGRTTYIALLNENAAALQRLVRLCAKSQFLADKIAAQPLLLDELIDDRLVDEPPTREQFENDLAARRAAIHAEDPERQVELLSQFQSAAIFRVAVADLISGLPLMKVSDRLTDIAELIVQEALALAWAQMTARHGKPRCVLESGEVLEPKMIVVAYGKLGGLELGYGSDLDLVFLHDAVGEGRTDGAHSLENTVFFQRLGQRLVHLLTVHTASGRLYEVDTRLRPGGNRGLLVQSLASFREYEFQEAWTWEHQSLLRARAIAGPAALRQEFEAARVEVLRKAVRRDDLRDAVRKMRERMRENLSKAKEGQFDMKQDPGGVADLEFLVQFWMLKWADRYPEIVTFSDNIRQLESLASGNLVPQSRVDFLVNTYRSYRRRAHRLSLDGAKNIVSADEFVEERRGVIEIWEEAMSGG
jgi:glutamate-ammonia-ligase adenylyltransferase